MSLSRSGEDSEASPPRLGKAASRALLAGSALLGVLLIAAASMLWYRNGTAVFFDMLAAGIAACF